MKKLKRCPFCGGKAVDIESEDSSIEEPIYYIECTKCGASTYAEYTLDEAISDWNRRAKNTD